MSLFAIVVLIRNRVTILGRISNNCSTIYKVRFVTNISSENTKHFKLQEKDNYINLKSNYTK